MDEILKITNNLIFVNKQPMIDETMDQRNSMTVLIKIQLFYAITRYKYNTQYESKKQEISFVNNLI